MNSLKILLFISSLLIFSACTEDGGVGEVTVQTKGLTNVVTVSFDTGLNLGEFSLSQMQTDITATIRNTTSLPITNLNLLITNNSFDFNFKRENNETPIFPGTGGTCQDQLASGASCTIKLFYIPRKSALYEEEVVFQYMNAFGLQTIKNTITALAGTPASLFFTDNKTTYDFGVFERTNKVTRFVTLELQNGGELTAKNLNLILTGNSNPLAFVLVSHTCPKNLKSNQSCEVTVSYEPQNWQPEDSIKVNYSGQLAVNYIRDPEGQLAALNSFYSFLSTNIEANFTNNLPEISFTELIVGNRETQNIKVTNTGYREGILKEVIFKDKLDQLWVKCFKPDTLGEKLKCLKPDLSIADLEFFPFQVKDLSSCLENMTEGKTPTSSGTSCTFALTFWPSTKYLVPKDFAETKIRFKYDSLWKDLTTIKEFEYFNITDASSLTAARIVLESFSYNGVTKPNTSINPDYTLHDIGRIALITAPSYGRGIRYRVRNIGNALALLSGPTSFLDGKGNTISTFPQTHQIFYQDILHDDCSLLNENDTCDITFKLSPLASNTAEENFRFYDVQNNILDRYKRFLLTYKNGSTFNDDGTTFVDRVQETRLTGVLVKKGFLVYDAFQVGKTLDIEVAAGSSINKNIILYNAGTGSIPYFTISNNLNLKNNTNAYYIPPLSIIAQAPPPGIHKDCHPLISFDETPPPAIPTTDTGLTLNPGEKCSLTIRLEKNPTAKVTTYTADKEITREFSILNNGTSNAWAWMQSPANRFVEFKYYDGDYSQPTPDLALYGNYFTIDEQFKINGAFQYRASVTPSNPFPLSSATLYRPQINLPMIIGPLNTLNSQTIPDQFFSIADAEAPSVLADSSIPYATGLVDNSAEYTIVAGSFPSSGSFDINFSLNNFGNGNATITNIALTSGAPEFTITAGDVTPMGPLSLSAAPEVHTVKLAFTPSGAGLKTAVVTYTYFNRFETVTKKVKIIAEAFTSFPDTTLTLAEYDVSYDSGTDITNATLQLIETSLSVGYNVSPTTPSILFESVKGSKLYDQKRIYIENTSGEIVDNLSVFTRKSEFATKSFTDMSVSMPINTCTGATLLPTQKCYVDMKYLPGKFAVSSTTLALSISYLFKNGQYTSKSLTMQFTGLSPADLTVVGKSTFQTSAPGIEFPEISEIFSSYSVDFGPLADPQHIVLTDFPSTLYQKTSYIVSNATDQKASFLASLVGSIPAGNPILIKDTGSTQVFATRACLYGDDEFDPGVPDDQKGFDNTNTLATGNACILSFNYNADIQHMGDSTGIDTSLSMLHLKFYDFKRASKNYLHFHVQGFVEPNRSIAQGPNYIEVQAFDTGEYSFKWPSFAPQNIDWGQVDAYRVYYADSPAAFSNIYASPPSSFDVIDGSNKFTFFGLPGKYMYFKVMALRQSGTTVYESDSQLPILKILIPPAGTIYDHEHGTIIERGHEPTGPIFLSEAENYCTTLNYTLVNGSSVVSINKNLIDLDAWNFLVQDESSSDYNTDSVPHWISTAPNALAPIFSIYGYDTTLPFFYNSTDNIGYNKSCANNSCDLLDLIKGGDGFDLPLAATFFVEGSVMKAIPRCYGQVL